MTNNSVLGKIWELLMVCAPFLRLLLIDFWLTWLLLNIRSTDPLAVGFENICFSGIYEKTISVICRR